MNMGWRKNARMKKQTFDGGARTDHRVVTFDCGRAGRVPVPRPYGFTPETSIRGIVEPNGRQLLHAFTEGLFPLLVDHLKLRVFRGEPPLPGDSELIFRVDHEVDRG